MDPDLVARVLEAVEDVPPGHVTTYGDIARRVGTGPRQVGAVMAVWGSAVAWWRVTNAAGKLPPHLLVEARRHWQEEGITVQTSGAGCVLARHRWS